ncbi:MAG: 50S ribosomal protein L7/L12 [uncultured bacterium]|nr:MAG: 50S ribosomal protein L7/L12 [uncultured bacterium]HBD05166.1 hypothetical protein [Candidatus Uhrbacteria bacterium]
MNQFFPEPDDAFGEDVGERKKNLAVKILKQVQDSLQTVAHLLEGSNINSVEQVIANLTSQKSNFENEAESLGGSRIIEGVFDGQNMVGSDGKIYNVPQNYASKSKLVEGDILKLTILADGSFQFKQIGPIDRKRVVGVLSLDSATGDFLAAGDDNHTYRLLKASVTYYKGMPGDEVVILVPKSAPSVWAAVENVVKKI